MINLYQKKHKLLRRYTSEEKEFAKKATKKYTGQILSDFFIVIFFMHFVSTSLVFSLMAKPVFSSEILLTIDDGYFLMLLCSLIVFPEYMFIYLSLFFSKNKKIEILDNIEGEDYTIFDSNYDNKDIEEALEMNFLNYFYSQKVVFYMLFLIILIIFI